MLELRPDSPLLNYISGEIALRTGDPAGLAAALSKLESLAGKEESPGEASSMLRALERLSGR